VSFATQKFIFYLENRKVQKLILLYSHEHLIAVEALLRAIDISKYCWVLFLFNPKSVGVFIFLITALTNVAEGPGLNSSSSTYMELEFNKISWFIH
jgi:hypothetical protein